MKEMSQPKVQIIKAKHMTNGSIIQTWHKQNNKCNTCHKEEYNGKTSQ